jgi:hypothetical protein
MALANGTRLGPYEIVAPLGAGGMGEVYRARDTRLDRTVAIKILPAHFADDAVRRQRFEREAKVISGLNHPNICTLHDIGHQDGVDFIVMEFLEGESLAERLEKGPLQAVQVLQYGTQIASALDKAPGLTPADILALWSADGQSVLAYRRAELPCRLERVDVVTGRRTLFKEFAPADRAGLLSLREIFVTDDLRSYAYTAYYQGSSLFVSDGKE